ncbi:flagellar hook-associated protein 2 [Nocardioides thalensis]|uniref:Flagellar hook-associated protein 2 n=1 Tax=Nocardioides thalensis TaxID=1914755 RepID=A0A853BZE5_9ACTN|nr:flagellar filament capping protein FliD [Nocardioides thalensis]NYI99841.1 flagellar hook-associated protein 2 [Nocardioides thalensis]
MASAIVSGLASGLDTATIINQLMQLEAVSQTKLKTRVTQEQSGVTALQQLNTRLASLAEAAKKLADVTTGTGPWSSLKATSTNTAVTVTATTSAAPGTFSVTVGQPALTHRLSFADSLAATDAVGAATLTAKDGTEIAIAGGSLKDFAAAINAADAGVRATLVKVGNDGTADQYRLLVESTTTGAAEDFQLTAADGSPLLGGAAVRAGQDATIDIGGIAASSSTNTFADVVPGVTITLAPGATGAADVAITRDAGARSAAVKSLVTDINQILESIRTTTAVNGKDPSKAGVLAGDSTVRTVASRLVESIYPATGSLAPYGIEVDRYGKLVFNEEKFAAAYTSDPDAVTAAFTGAGGFASRVEAVAKTASDRFTGSITTNIDGRAKGIDRLNDSIAQWDTRLALRRQTLERQYTALETALSRMNSQSAWLTSQLQSLSSGSEE